MIPGLVDPRLDGHYQSRVDAIMKCAEAAHSRGFKVFAIQDGGWCGSSGNAECTYTQQGPSTACNADGEGGAGANQVYKISSKLNGASINYVDSKGQGGEGFTDFPLGSYVLIAKNEKKRKGA